MQTHLESTTEKNIRAVDNTELVKMLHEEQCFSVNYPPTPLYMTFLSLESEAGHVDISMRLNRDQFRNPLLFRTERQGQNYVLLITGDSDKMKFQIDPKRAKITEYGFEVPANFADVVICVKSY